MALNANTVSCKKLGKIFEALTKHEYDLIDFTRNVLKSEYKNGLEKGYPTYYSQGVEYYYECFEEWFPNLKKTEVKYNTEALYWMGYLFQHWYVKLGINGVELETKLSDDMIIKLYKLWDVYHTQDLEYVYEDIFKVSI